MPSELTRRARWYVDRLRVMPPGEWAHRARQAARVAADRSRPRPVPAARPVVAGWPRPDDAPVLVDDAAVEAVRALPGAVDAARARADRIALGTVTYFGYPPAHVSPDPDWHRDAVSGRRWPEEHWSRINHREVGLDPKWIWELGRHQEIVALARAWRLTGDEAYSRAAARHLDGFLAQAPPGHGIHWRSGLELGVRLISWAWVVELLRGSDELTPERGGRLLASAGAHLEQLARYPSRYSSANNHLIGEAAGLAVGGLAFPEIAGAAALAKRGLAELREALAAQVLPDGVDAEQAVGYHGFVLELGLAVAACLRGLGRPVPAGLAEPLCGVAAFVGTLASDGLTLPRIGDEDEGLGVDLGPRMSDPERLRFRLRATRALLDAELPRQEEGVDEPTIWLCGAARAAAAGAARLPGSAVFPHGGYAVLRSRDERGEVRAVLDAGPLGLPPMSAHGHADLLSVCLSVDGAEVLIDPGTFTYFGEERWRAYGRSTGAHSTVMVDGRDQAETGGRFMWRSQPAATLEAYGADEGGWHATGRHSAYAPVRHERRVELAGRVLTVTDVLAGPPQPRDVEVRWHLAAGSAAPLGDGWRWEGGGRSVAIRIDGLADQRVAEGDEATPLGFWSDGLERRAPSPVVVARGRAGLPLTVTTVIDATGR